MKTIFIMLTAVLVSVVANAKTLIVYYSFTNNIHTIVSDLQTQTGADAVRIEPAEEGVDYAADNYAIGSALISAIRNRPDDVSSYPEIKPVDVDLDEYDMIIVAAPLWWGNMAAPMQTFLFHNGAKMSGKKTGLIVSSASSGISGVEADARRLIPKGDFLTPGLWIRSSQTSDCHSRISRWLEQIGYDSLTGSIRESMTLPGIDINVVTDKIIVNGDFDTFTLYSLSGFKILESTERTVATSVLAPGIYLAYITSGTGCISRRIILSGRQ